MSDDRLFDAMDVNQDGVVDRDEFETFMNDENFDPHVGGIPSVMNSFRGAPADLASHASNEAHLQHLDQVIANASTALIPSGARERGSLSLNLELAPLTPTSRHEEAHVTSEFHVTSASPCLDTLKVRS